MQMLQNHAGAQNSMGAYGVCVHPWGAYEHMGVYEHMRGHTNMQ